MTTDSPNFGHYEIEANGSTNTTVEPSFHWDIAPVYNRLTLRVIDAMGNAGPSSSLEVSYVPQ
jgi:hypothetical protein